MTLTDEEFQRFLRMEVDEFLTEYGRLLNQNLEKAQSLSRLASVVFPLLGELIRTQRATPTENDIQAFSDIQRYVYLLSAIGTDLYKIGSSSDVISSANDTTLDSPYLIVVLEVMKSQNPNAEKRRLHSMFANNKVTEQWFKFSESELPLVRQQFHQ